MEESRYEPDDEPELGRWCLACGPPPGVFHARGERCPTTDPICPLCNGLAPDFLSLCADCIEGDAP